MVLDEEINYKEEFKKCLKDFSSFKTFYRQIPNLLTFSRALGAPVISFLFLKGYLRIGIISTLFLFLTDAIDGKLARKWEVESKFGADLDAFCDKIMFLGLSIPLLMSNPIVLINFISEGIISLINVVGRINGLNTKTVFSGKVKTWFLSFMLGMGYLVKFFKFPTFALNLMVGLTFISQGVAVFDYIKEYKIMKKEKNEKINVVSTKSNDLVEKEEYSYNKSLVDNVKYEKDFLKDSELLDEDIKPLSRKRIRGKR